MARRHRCRANRVRNLRTGGRCVRSHQRPFAPPSRREDWARRPMTQGAQPVLDLAGMTPADLAALRSAVQSLEHPGLAARFTNMVGKPIELIGYALPASASQAITAATSKALEMALDVALRSMHHTPRAGSQLFHKALD